MDNDFFHHAWAMDIQSADHFASSMTASPVTSNPNLFNDSVVLGELIGKLANIGDSVSPQSHHAHPLLGNLNSSSMANTGLYTSGNNSTNTSCYNTPLNSPPKVALNSSLMNLSGDPGFAERAARLSSFGSRSFNDRTRQNHQYSMNGDSGFGYGSNGHLMGRVASSPSLKSLKTKSPLTQDSDSPISDEIPNDFNPSRKRRAIRKEKSVKAVEGESDSIVKRRKMIQNNGNENVKSEVEQKGNNANTGADSEVQEQTKNNQQPVEPLKDYIHVRARRGQATDSHSLAERVRREKIGERMKLLQDLVPGCNKVTGKALMLDEIINYVQSLQHQVEFLSMKLASVDFRTELNMESHPSNHHFTGTIDMLDTVKCQNLSMHLPHLDGFGHGISQFQVLGEDDLQSLVQMGLARS